MPPKVPAKQPAKAAVPVAKSNIMPPTKQQVQASKTAVKADGPTVVTSANLNKLLNRQAPPPEFADEKPLNLQQMPVQPSQHYPPQSQNFQPQQQSYNNNQQQNIQSNQPNNQFNEPSPDRQPYRPSDFPSYSNPKPHNSPPPPQQQNPPFQQKKPSLMSNKEFEEYERGRELKNWRRLIDIVVFRTPSTFEKNECEDHRKNPEFNKLYQLAVQQKENGVQRMEEPKQEQQWKPSGPSGNSYAQNQGQNQGQNQQPPVQNNAQNNLPMQNNGNNNFQAANQGYQQPQPSSVDAGFLIQQNQLLQQQMLQMQQFQIPQPLPNVSQANPHLLQQIQDLQLEIQITQQQAGKHQMDSIRLERENSQLKSEIQQEKQARQKAEFKVQQMALDLEELRAQINTLRETIQKQNTILVRNSTPVNINYQPVSSEIQQTRDSAAQNIRVQSVQDNQLSPIHNVYSQQVQFQQPIQNQAQNSIQYQKIKPIPVQQQPQVEDPNFQTTSIDAIMKNANIILTKYQNFDNEQSPSGQQLNQIYKQMLHKAPIPDDIERLLSENPNDYDEQDVTRPPDEIPASLLNGVPDYEEGLREAEEQFQQQQGEFDTENIGSLLPKSKYNSRAKVMRK
ncbi:Conserved_hypothetical protein [Hexamita inflata]|uniref:Uncharacterized protein n=1 Tax=Hexamita inflata TaxID=28002 RepID=A0AA86P6W5_9EUKA|nr:Conserved hypothetical protein [Hexamita inflata]